MNPIASLITNFNGLNPKIKKWGLAAFGVLTLVFWAVPKPMPSPSPTSPPRPTRTHAVAQPEKPEKHEEPKPDVFDSGDRLCDNEDGHYRGIVATIHYVKRHTVGEYEVEGYVAYKLTSGVVVAHPIVRVCKEGDGR